MLIEDSPTQAARLRAELTAAQLEVAVFSSAEAALEQLSSLRPDVIVVDYHLPGRNGDDFCRAIKSDVNTRAIPVLMLTVDDSDAAQMRGLGSGADEYVAKSADPDILRARIGALLRESQSTPPIVTHEVTHEQRFATPRLLAIDDSPSYLYYIAHELRRENYQVDTAADPREGLEKLSKNKYDCVLVDFEMPGMGAPEVCRYIRERGDQANPQVVLIILSSHEDKDHMKQGFEAGADDYISKSADIAVTRARVGALLRRKFLVEQNRQILSELQEKELETIRARAAREAAELKAILADQLAAANQELARTNAKLDAANRELEQFASSAAHDLKEPLRMIGAYSQLIQQEYASQLDARAHQFISYCIEGVERMDRLITDLLTYARAASTETELPRAVVDLNAVVATALANLQGIRRDIDCEIVVEPLPTLLLEEMQIQQVLQNLIGNAIKYRRPDAAVRIHVSAQRRGNEWLFSVQDNGIGIAEKDLAVVFELFTRLQQTSSSGTGLGLAIARRIVQRHGGRIWVESRLGEGSTFHFTLPDSAATESKTAPALLSPNQQNLAPMVVARKN
jgi:two-component system NtrC family sensor kinase